MICLGRLALALGRLLFRSKHMTYGWEEVLERLSVDEGEVHAAEHPSERVLDGFLEPVPSAADLFLLSAVGEEDAVLCHLPLFFRQPSGVLGPVGQKEESDHADKDTGCALDDEEPLPAIDNSSVLELRIARRFG